MSIVAVVGARAARIARAVVPDPWIIAIALAALAWLAGALLGRRSPGELLGSLAFGMFEPGLLAFAMQMVLMLMTGSAIANAPPVARAIRALADVPRTSADAATVVAAWTMALGLVNWGLGMVAGALLTREVAASFVRRQLPLNLGVVGAAGFLSAAIWHGGLSGSAPLKVASVGAYGAAIPVGQTLFSPLNLVVTPAIFIALTLLMRALGKNTNDAARPTLPELPLPSSEGEAPTALSRLESMPVIMLLLAVPIAIALVRAVGIAGTPAITLDWVILLFLVAGLLLHKDAMSYAKAFGRSAPEAAGIILQFPLYFGIVAVARDSGLVEVVSRGFTAAAISAAHVLSPTSAATVFTYLSACVVNCLIPSGGGQWVVQSPLLLEMATQLGVDRAALVMPFAYGDETTNLLQPFWALPLLAISGLKAKDIMGYTLVAMVVEGAIVLTCLLLLA